MRWQRIDDRDARYRARRRLALLPVEIQEGVWCWLEYYWCLERTSMLVHRLGQERVTWMPLGRAATFEAIQAKAKRLGQTVSEGKP